MDFYESKGFAISVQLADAKILWRPKRIQIAHAVNVMFDHEQALGYATSVSGLEEQEIIQLMAILRTANIYELDLDELARINKVFEPKPSTIPLFRKDWFLYTISGLLVATILTNIVLAITLWIK